LRRVAASRGIDRPLPSQATLDLLQDSDELELIRKLSAFPVVLQTSAVELEPHRMAYYLRELAGLLHPFYNKHRILPPAPESETAGMPSTEVAVSANRQSEVLTPGLTGARLALMWSVQQVVRNGLNVLGVSAPEQM
ncbi:MAG: arginine--tRNA ligase, partial [Nitrospira sp.]|nr:arginine--tRNA ligase [Nitrospira sp.]